MSVQRRKDNKGRVLKNGESQRKNGSYMYRYSDAKGIRHTVYAPDLKTLREKEEKIQKDIINNIDLSKDKITVSAYFKSYLDQKKNIKSTTRSNYEVIFLYLKKYGLGNANKERQNNKRKEFCNRYFQKWSWFFHGAKCKRPHEKPF